MIFFRPRSDADGMVRGQHACVQAVICRSVREEEARRYVCGDRRCRHVGKGCKRASCAVLAKARQPHYRAVARSGVRVRAWSAVQYARCLHAHDTPRYARTRGKLSLPRRLMRCHDAELRDAPHTP